MALDLGAIRNALAEQIQARLDDSDYRANCYGYAPDSPELPAVIVRPKQNDGRYVQFHETFSDHAISGVEMEIEVRVKSTAPGADDQRALDAYCSTGTTASILNAVESDLSIGGTVQNVMVRGVTSPRYFAAAAEGREWVAVVFDLVIMEAR